MERALSFYRDLLGMEVLSEARFSGDTPEQVMALEAVDVYSVMLSLGDVRVELFEFDSPTPVTMDESRPVCDHGFTHICFEVTDIDDEYRRLQEAGIRFHCPPVGVGELRVTYGRDPDGNVFELLSP
jgi:catechol 2,3-dioxygenase-like lactoylglutathione lyase family enzyme|tara:strand:+ start:1320 stop:1700 length:381 start_codon:yes stop_codon:yes gene_type:complete